MPTLLNDEHECQNCEYWDSGICDKTGWLCDGDDTCKSWHKAPWLDRRENNAKTS